MVKNHNIQHTHIPPLCIGKRISPKASKSAHKINTKLSKTSIQPTNITLLSKPSDLPTHSEKVMLHDIPTTHTQPNTTYETPVLLPTVSLELADSKGRFHKARALLDSGSMLTLLTKNMAKRLHIPLQRTELNITGVGGQHSESPSSSAVITFHPIHSQKPVITVKAYILENLTGFLPLTKLPKFETFVDTSQIPLADLSYNLPAPVDLILGSDILGQILDGSKISLGPGRPVAFGTIFNFALVGPINEQHTKPEPQANSAQINITSSQPQHTSEEIHSALERFWEVEEVQGHPKVNSAPDECEDIFQSTTTRDATGRYIVSLPFLSDAPKFGTTHGIALRRFLNLERKLQRDDTLRSKYIDFMQEYIRLGHMTLCHPSSFSDKTHFYIPHHGIFKTNCEKIRTVFDGSCKSSNGISLNDCLHTGPALQRDITDIILNFRTHQVVFSTDIQMMFRNILVHPDHRRFQLILWRSSPDQPLLTYALSTVTYGLRPSPFLANRTILQLVADEGHRFPQAAQVLSRSIFVDDILTGHDSVENAQALQTELIELLALGGFNLRKWTSNSRDLLERFPDDQCDMPKDFDLSPNSNAISVLGMQWIPQTDRFTYRISVPVLETFTKRSILSTIARLFDPNGWISPVIFRAKLLIQHLWTLKLDWDEPAPTELSLQCQKIFDDLPRLSALQLPRKVCCNRTSTYTLHGFADASESGYAAVVYLHETEPSGEVHVNLLIAKSKVAPIKNRQTIPKLELSAAHLLSQLISRVSAQLSTQIQIQHHYCWSDSTIVLAWLNTSPQLLQVFEANRVSSINANSCNLIWRHVTSALNPADCASRGMAAQDILTHDLWWSPAWLKAPPDSWPKMPPALGHHLLPGLKSRKMVAHIAVPDLDTDLIARFSSLDTLIGVTACIKRFAHNCRVKRDARLTGPLTVSERKEALLHWVRSVQHNMFAEDIHRLRTNKECTTRLQRLSPFLKDDLLRVGGRLANSALRYEARHPLILPSSNTLVDLIIDHYHKIHCHAGFDTLHAILRQQFWILSARRVIRHRVYKCIRCFKCRPQLKAPFMADLPADRVNPQPIFAQVSTDFAGPFLIKSSTLRNAKLLKGYFCIFVCLATKAVHLEAVSELSTDAFMAALQRFVSRRGVPTLIRSDCGTNYVGARNQLIDIQNFLANNNDKIANKLTKQHITWWLNPPSAPSFGGLHETAVKSTKQLLYRIIGEQRLTFEEFSTLLTRIEAILNSRPLCPLSSDPSALEPLTAGHFLIGRPITAFPEPPFDNRSLSALKRFQLIQALSQHFWSQWTRTYLHTLQTRSKWLSKSAPPQVGELVLIKEDNLPPLHWKMGRIIRTMPGKDGVTRVVELHTANGTLQRPVLKLARLPIDLTQDSGSTQPCSSTQTQEELLQRQD